MIFFEPREGAAADEQDVGGVDLQELLLRMLSGPPCGGTEATVPSMIFSSACLHALARHVAGDRRIVGLAADLVDFVDIDDAALCALDIVVRPTAAASG